MTDNWTKEQRNSYQRGWHVKNLEKDRATHREWMRTHPESKHIAQVKWYAEHKEIILEQQKKYAQDNPQTQYAQGVALYNFPDAQLCSVEGCYVVGERHHPDYSKPLEIIWLCHKHHMALRRKYID